MRALLSRDTCALLAAASSSAIVPLTTAMACSSRAIEWSVVRTAAASSLKSERDAFFCRGVSGDAAVADLGFMGLGTGLPDRPGLPGRPGLRPRGADAARPFEAAAPMPAIFGTGEGGSATGGGGAGGIAAPGRQGIHCKHEFCFRRAVAVTCALWPYRTGFRVHEKECHAQVAAANPRRAGR